MITAFPKYLIRAAVRAGLLTALLASQCLLSNAQDVPTAPQVIKRIVVHAPKPINKAAIASESGLHIGDPILPGTLREARRKLWYNGTFDDRDPGERLVVRSEGKLHEVTVFIEIDRYPVLKRIEVKGTDPISAGEVIQALGIKRGTILTNQLLRDRFQRVLHLYDRKGYIGLVNDYDCTEGVLEVEIAVCHVGEVSFGNVPIGRMPMAELANRPGGYYRPKALKKDREVLEKAGWVVEAEPTILTNKNLLDLDVEWRTSQPLSKNETAVLNVGLNTLTRQWPKRILVLLDRAGLGDYRPIDARFKVGDMEPVYAEFRKIAASPGYLIELQFTNWSNALHQIYPGYDTYIAVRRLDMIGSDRATLGLFVGPPDMVHAGRRPIFHLNKIAGKWNVEKWQDF